MVARVNPCHRQTLSMVHYMTLETIIKDNYTFLESEEILSFCKKFNLLEIFEKEIADSQSVISDLESGLEDARDTIDVQETRLEEREAKIEELEGDIDDLKDEIKQLEKQNADLEKDLEAVRND